MHIVDKIINKVIKTLNKSNCYQIDTPMRFIKNPTESKLFKYSWSRWK